jgi:hypothetical protein
MKKFTFSLLLIYLLLTGCDYQPLYSSKNLKNFSLDNIEFNENSEINDLLNNSLRRYQINESDNPYNVLINSDYKKIEREKDSSGKITQFEIIINVRFELFNKDRKDNFEFTESTLMQSYSNKIEEQQYERSIKSNMVRNIVNKFELKIRNF